MAKDYYEILGVPRDADENALKRAYRKVGYLATCCSHSAQQSDAQSAYIYAWRTRHVPCSAALPRAGLHIAALHGLLSSMPSTVQLAVQYHPDKAKGDRAQAEEKFKDLSSAYATLSGGLNICAEMGRTPRCSRVLRT